MAGVCGVVAAGVGVAGAGVIIRSGLNVRRGGRVTLIGVGVGVMKRSGFNVCSGGLDTLIGVGVAWQRGRGLLWYGSAEGLFERLQLLQV